MLGRVNDLTIRPRAREWDRRGKARPIGDWLPRNIACGKRPKLRSDTRGSLHVSWATSYKNNRHRDSG